MTETIATIAPVLIALIVYFVRVETRLTKILTDLCWIKKELKPCPGTRKEGLQQDNK